MNFKNYLDKKAGKELVHVKGYGVISRMQAHQSALDKAKEIVQTLERGNPASRGQIMLLEAFNQASIEPEFNQ